MSDVIAFGEAYADRIDQVVRRVEGADYDAKAARKIKRQGGGEVVMLRVTSTTPTSGLYPAVLEWWSYDTVTWTDGEGVWYLPRNGKKPNLGSRLCRRISAREGVVIYTDANYPAQIAFRASNATQSIPNNTLTTLTAWANYEDDADFISGNGFVTPVVGIYVITATVIWATNGTGYRQTYLKLNPGAISSSHQDIRSAVTGERTVQQVSLTGRIGVGTTITVQVKQTSGGALDCGLYGLGESENTFAITRLN